jgi:uncharacterized membrane protein
VTTWRRIWVGAALAIGALFGLAPAASRSVDSLRRMYGDERGSTAMSAMDRTNVDLSLRIYGQPIGSSGTRALEGDLTEMIGKFAVWPRAILFHVGAAVVFLLLVPLQFSRTIRVRHPRVHRWSGRVILLTVASIAGAGFFFGIGMPYAGPSESIPVVIFGSLFVYSAARGWWLIRRDDRVRHREWMIRMVAVAYGAAIQRVTSFPLLMITGRPPSEWFVTSVWIGFVTSVAIAELYIRRPQLARRYAYLSE